MWDYDLISSRFKKVNHVAYYTCESLKSNK